MFALLRALAALLGTIFVLLALLYSGYLNYTDLEPPEAATEPSEVTVDTTGRRIHYARSWLAREGRLWHVHLEGSPVELGDAHGHLLARQFRELDEHIRTRLDRRYAAWIESWAAQMRTRWDYRGADRHIRDDEGRELAALAAALPEAGEDRLDNYHLLFLYQCFQELSERLEDVVVEGNMFATVPQTSGSDEPGNLVIGRSFSVDLGLGFEPERSVTFYYPDGKYPFVSVGWAGLMGVVTGINARSVFVAINPARTDDPLEDGAPLPLVLRQVLEEADSLERAIEILREADLRTSGVVLIGDGFARKTAIMELAPRAPEERRVVRGEEDDIVWATDHLLRDVFERDAQNDWIKRYTSSGYRHDRLEQLLRQDGAVDPERAVEILRDRRGIDNEQLGLGNRNALESLTITHGVVVDATAMVMWVSEGPSVLGRFHAFDLRHLLTRGERRPAPLDDIPADALLYSEEFKDYGEALEAIEHARFLLLHGQPERARWSAKIALALAPDIGDLHRLLGDIERELGNGDEAKLHYLRYLELVPGRLRDQERVRGILAELGA